MNVELYIEKAIRTEGDPLLLNAKWKAEQDAIAIGYSDPYWFDPVRILHAAIGLHTEIHELKFEWDGSQENLREELGDICWYCAIALSALPTVGFDVNRDFDAKQAAEMEAEERIQFYLDELDFLSGEFASHAKAGSMYNRRYIKETGQSVSATMVGIIKAILKVVNSMSVRSASCSLGWIMDENIKKLQRRYPDKFTNEAANERADKE